MEKQTKAQTGELRANAVEAVKRLAPEGSRIGYVDLSYSKSGMSRRVSFVVYTSDAGFFRLDKALARIVGYPVPENGEGVRIMGTGMDTGRDAVENLSRVVYGRPDALVAERL